jgi:FtsH-binding integral membrane protein
MGLFDAPRLHRDRIVPGHGGVRRHDCRDRQTLIQASTALQWTISVAGVLAFAGLTASDTQRLKNEYIYGAMDCDTAARNAILGELSLYLDFVNLFALLLQLQRERGE